MGKYLDQCCADAWDVIKGRKKIVGNDIVEVVDELGDEESLYSVWSEYGWLAPNGKFYPVEFGKHQVWATEYLYHTDRDLYKKVRIDNQEAGDILFDLGWVLIHNPTRLDIKITRNLSKKLSKTQKDFLYEFLRKHDRLKEANELYS